MCEWLSLPHLKIEMWGTQMLGVVSFEIVARSKRLRILKLQLLDSRYLIALMPLLLMEAKSLEAEEEIHMKRFLGYAAMLALLSAPAFAAKNSENITISNPVTVGTTQVPAASYKVAWTSTGSNSQVTLTHGKSVFTLPAKVVEQKNNVSSVLTQTKDGANVLEGINLSNVTVTFTSVPSSGQ